MEAGAPAPLGNGCSYYTCPYNIKERFSLEADREIMAGRDKETGNEVIEKNIRTYMTLLQGSVDIQIDSFAETHLEMEPALHPQAESKNIDITAFIYAAIRLPDCIYAIKKVLLGQSEEVFKGSGIEDIFHWREVTAGARRRRTVFDGKGILAFFITSISDIDDIAPSLVVFQTEWNKMNTFLSGSPIGEELASGKINADEADEALRKCLDISAEDWRLLRKGWGEFWNEKMKAIAAGRKAIRLTLIKGGFSEYRRVVQQWWTGLARHFEETLIEFRPIYLASSNMYSFSHMITGFATKYRKDILEFAFNLKPEGFERQWAQFQSDDDEKGMADLLYYMARDFINSSDEHMKEFKQMEAEAGIMNFTQLECLDLPVQIIDIRKVIPERMDNRLRMKKIEALRESRAMIVNIDYPLGFAAYHVFSQIAASAKKILGVYILGKAATMSARLGDIMIPNEIYDLHSKNTFYFKNCFSLKDFHDLIRNIAVLDRQKALTVRGTFLQNRTMMQDFHKENFNSVEMEAGPYLCAIYENIFPDRYPVNAVMNLHNEAENMYDLGFLYYASDTPYHRRESLLSRSMGISGIESVYACSAATLRKIFTKEIRNVLEE
jgi:hypothetical protein